MPEAPIDTAAGTRAQAEWLTRVLGVAAPVPPPPQDGGLEAFNKRLADVIGILKPALVAQHPGATDAKLKVSEAGVFARKQEFDQAHALLDAAEALLAGWQEATPTINAPGATSAPVTGSTGAVVYAKSRLAWLSTRRMLEDELEQVRSKMMEHYARVDTRILTDLNRAFAVRTERMLTRLDETLANQLDDATNETDPQKRAALVSAAQATIKRYQDYVNSEKIFQDLDKNPFAKVSVTATITKTLAALSAAVR